MGRMGGMNSNFVDRKVSPIFMDVSGGGEECGNEIIDGANNKCTDVGIRRALFFSGQKDELYARLLPVYITPSIPNSPPQSNTPNRGADVRLV